MTVPRYGAGSAVLAAADSRAHRLLVVGGLGTAAPGLESTELYDAIEDRWIVHEACLSKEMQWWCEAAPIAGGGAVLSVASLSSETTACALLDVRSNATSWQRVASPPNARRHLVAVAVGEHLVALLGGRDATSAPTNTVQLYDAAANRWTERDEWSLPSTATGHCAAFID